MQLPIVVSFVNAKGLPVLESLSSANYYRNYMDTANAKCTSRTSDCLLFRKNDMHQIQSNI